MFLYGNRAAFTEPRRLVEPFAWAGHIPFAFWLVSALRPLCIVELGTHTGNSFCAFAQAIENNGLKGAVHAVDHWRGDEHAGQYSDAVHDELAHYVGQLHPKTAIMVRSAFDDAVDQFADKSIDLLHIDGMHTYEAVRHDFLTWLPKMAETGVVLFHDTAVTVRDFGVGRFFNELSTDHRTIELPQSHGLGILALGEVSDPVGRLLSGEPDDAGLTAVDVFSRLGNGLLGRAHAERFSQSSDPRRGSVDRIHLIHEIRERLDTLTRGLTREQELAGSFRSPYTGTGSAAGLLATDLLSSGYFSPAHYAQQTGLRGETDRDLCLHYLLEGEKSGYTPSSDFDPQFYAQSNPDVVESGYGLLEHFVLFGIREERLPKPQAESPATTKD